MTRVHYCAWWFLLAVCVTLAVSPSVPNPAHRARVADVPLSGRKHFDGSEGKVHNAEFDHDAFLGHDEARKFDDMTPAESKRKLGLLFIRIDINADGSLSEDELKVWMKQVQHKNLWSESQQTFSEIGQGRDFVTWEEYRAHTYKSEHDSQDEQHDKRRWERADVNKNSVLSREEFNNFVHPEMAEHMKDLVVQDTLDEVDTNHDGFISFEEYMSDAGDSSEEDEDATWIKEEEEEFKNELDQNKDGRLDQKEIYRWLIPDDYDHIHEETKHLFDEADANQDGLLKADEVINNYELFVGSQATDYGDIFKREEL